ncbi:unnamed protein product [Allacma fusca]|uniref:Uncharacterized protein n=1 Tax=Allacma fusca TaxID=39272 RepID=A0A8J2J9U0_9HEXA|nr:unnamed protein product [Allacma fusca]
MNTSNFKQYSIANEIIYINLNAKRPGNHIRFIHFQFLVKNTNNYCFTIPSKSPRYIPDNLPKTRFQFCRNYERFAQMLKPTLLF